MIRSSPFLNRWLSQVGPSIAMEALSDMLDCGALYGIDQEGRILFWSRGAEALLGYGPEQVLGQPCNQAIRGAGERPLCCIAEQGSVKGDAVELLRADGGKLRVRRSARAFFDAEGRFAGALEVLWPEAGFSPPSHAEGKVEEFHGIITRDPVLKQAFRIVRNVAETEATVLIRGETGSGKELFARAIHAESHRRDRPFLAVNCAALSPSLLESELFGHKRGAFTGAVKDHAGLFQRADGGTLFLDEVAELPLELQAKLLRVLQERDFVPVGGDRAVRVDVRIVAATHRSLRQWVKEGKFREDLMYRLRVVPIFLPPLRERRQDMSLLLWRCIDRHNARGQRKILRVEPEAMRRLLDHAWPGNVRELQNVVEYAFAVGRGEALRLEDLPPEFREASQPEPIRPDAPPREESERIREALAVAGGRIDEAARLLGMSRATFWRKRKQYGI
ncbi:MAG: sigma 54-interacting transcriptional regulator [Methylococcaceae bacterium]|nr:sigma 54-interacting transcriptional regulator [Methylococcaceae bacterium]